MPAPASPLASDLARQRCANHAHREAVALCPGCKQFYCRECVTEHDDRVWCSSCLKRLEKPTLGQRLRLGGLKRLAQFIFAFLILWMIFYFCGRTLLAMPSSFHEGTYLEHWESEE